MHVVECPSCRRTFRVAQAVTGVRMKCSRCGQSFVGSSTEAPDAAQASSASAAHPRPAVRPRPRSNSGPLMLVICCVAAAGIVVLAAVFYWIRTHPTVVQKDERTGEVVGKGRVSRRQAEREIGRRPGPGGEDDRLTPGVPPDRRPGTDLVPGSHPAPGPGEPAGDPKLEAGQPALVEAGAVGERTFACGQILSKYEAALRQVSVTAYVDGRRGPSWYCPYVPPRGRVRYCVEVQGKDLSADRVRIVAAAQPLRAGLVVWEIPPADVRRAAVTGEVAAWTGTVRNPASLPLKDIRIILDYYDDEGIWGGRAEGRLEDRTTLGVGKSGFFRVSTGELHALEQATSSIVVARAVAEQL